MKPSPEDAQDLLLGSYHELGLDPLLHDFRFVEDDWEGPTLGAWASAGKSGAMAWRWASSPTSSRSAASRSRCRASMMTYGLERLAMYVQDVDNVYDLDFNGAGVTYGDVFLRAEREYSAFNFEHADPALLTRHFADAEQECAALLEQRLALPAYDQCIKASHLFNLLDARGVISVTERASYIARAHPGEGLLRSLGCRR